MQLQLDAAPATADGLAAWVADEMQRAASSDIPWQAVIDAIRPHLRTLWARLDDAERQRFLDVHRSKWEVIRHRTPSETRAALDAWRAAGAVVTHRGGIAAIRTTEDAIVVQFDGEAEPMAFDRIVLCTGAESDPRRMNDPLWDQLLRDGIARVDAHGLGVLTEEDGRVIAADGRAQPLWAAGGLQRPRWFESTAVPELAVQAQRIAAALHHAHPPEVP